jgi:hypothetical protein
MSFPRCVVAMTTDEERSIDIMQPNIRDFAFDKQNLIGVGNPELTLVEMAQ